MGAWAVYVDGKYLFSHDDMLSYDDPQKTNPDNLLEILLDGLGIEYKSTERAQPITKPDSYFEPSDPEGYWPFNLSELGPEISLEDLYGPLPEELTTNSGEGIVEF